jgi:thiol-disulfide isomerase/thioredoxin
VYRAAATPLAYTSPSPGSLTPDYKPSAETPSMKSLLRLAFAALLLALPTLPADAQDEPVVDYAPSTVNWTASYGEGVKQAREEGRPILLKFYANWCPHCEKMDEGTWQDEYIGELSQHFVPIRINGETGTVALKRYNLGNVPLTIVAEPHGVEVFRIEGQANARKIAAYLEAYLAHAEELAASFATLREDKNDPVTHFTLGRFYQGVGLTEKAGLRFQSAMKNAEGAVWLDACAAAVSALVQGGQYKKARKLVEKGLARAGDAPSPALLLAKGRVEAGLGKPSAARPWFERVVNEHAGSTEATAAERALSDLSSKTSS